MQNTASLPAGYTECLRVDLQHNKKLALAINLAALAIAAAMAVPAAFIVPIRSLFDMSQGLLPYALRFLALLAGCFLYIVLHEAVHGVCIRIYSGRPARYGFTGMYAFAGSDHYFARGPYLVIALAPVVFWGIILAVGCAVVPRSWFWVVYIIQICNISGAAGDLYVTWRFSRLPADILVQDTGTAMTVYSARG